MKKHYCIGLFSAFALTIFLMTSTEVHAAEDIYGRLYNTWMQINDNVLFTSKERFFYQGYHSIQISFDEWNSSICTSPNDSSLVTINLFDNKKNRAVAYKNMSTHLYTCNKVNFGTFNQSYYVHYFLTFNTKQEKFCGYRSNSVIMQSAA